MQGYSIVRATTAMVLPLMRDVRPEDLSEWIEASRRVGLLPHWAERPGEWVRSFLHNSVKNGKVVYAIQSDTDPEDILCIYGVSPDANVEGVGVAWLIGTKKGQDKARSIQRLFEDGVKSLHAYFPVLEAHVYAVNSFHVYWLNRMGFRDEGPSNLIPGEAFRRMSRRAK